jgi:hypothetical protein
LFGSPNATLSRTARLHLFRLGILASAGSTRLFQFSSDTPTFRLPQTFVAGISISSRSASSPFRCGCFSLLNHLVTRTDTVTEIILNHNFSSAPTSTRSRRLTLRGHINIPIATVKPTTIVALPIATTVRVKNTSPPATKLTARLTLISDTTLSRNGRSLYAILSTALKTLGDTA